MSLGGLGNDCLDYPEGEEVASWTTSWRYFPNTETCGILPNSGGLADVLPFPTESFLRCTTVSLQHVVRVTRESEDGALTNLSHEA